jgi:PhzF family phenazine biosynthesis protein
MNQRPFKQVDVFTATPYLGNALAVVLDGTGLTDAEMQRFANWTNLSETTFLLPPTTPDADYKVRIFTASRELPFAGHPTLGSCHAWLQAGGQPHTAGVVVQECGAGLVHIKHDAHGLAFAAPKLVHSGPVNDATQAQIARSLRVPTSNLLHAQWANNGPGWVAVLLPSAQQVLAIEPDYEAMRGLWVGVVGAYPSGSECQFEVRAFVPNETSGGWEDPVTGSLNASVAQWLIGAGLAPERYIASQGTVLGRAGRVKLMRDGAGQVWVGGAVVTCVSGAVLL